MDELQNEPVDCGTHRLICVKHRHLGPDVYRALSPVEMPDGSKKKNYINMQIENFNLTDKGDLKDMADKMILDDAELETDNNFFTPPNL